jgi:alpha-1,2-mannosyltransferase
MSQEPQCLELIENEDERRIRRNWRVIGAIAVAAAGVLALQALLHGHLSAIDEYDDSVYFGASIELLHGVMPYRDFAFIQPPLITVWMLPFAATSSIVGTASAMEMGRIFVDIVTVTNIVLVGALVRRRTTLQVIAATGLMAFSQGTVRSSQTILLEPFLVLACLVALLCLMDGETITTSSRRHWWCGVCFGVAGATKVWAIFPLLAVVIVLSRSGMLPR